MAQELFITAIRQLVGAVATVTTINHFAPDKGTAVSAQEVAENIEAGLLPVLNAMQGVHVANVELYTRNATTSNDAWTIALTGGGGRAAAGTAILPAYLSAGFRWKLGDTQYGVQTPVMLRSFTRIPGLLDADVTDGRLSGSFMPDFGDAFAAEWTEIKTFGGQPYYAACHVNPEGLENTWRIKLQEVVMSCKLGTQNTRKY